MHQKFGLSMEQGVHFAARERPGGLATDLRDKVENFCLDSSQQLPDSIDATDFIEHRLCICYIEQSICSIGIRMTKHSIKLERLRGGY